MGFFSDIVDSVTDAFDDAVDWVDDNIVNPINDAWNYLEEDPRNIFTLAFDPLGLSMSTDWALHELGMETTPYEWFADKTSFDKASEWWGENDIGTYAALSVAAWAAAGVAAGGAAAGTEAGAVSAGEAAATALEGAASSGGFWTTVAETAAQLGDVAWETIQTAGTALQEVLGTEASGAWASWVNGTEGGSVWGLIQEGLSKGFTTVADMAGFLGISEASLVKTGVMGVLGLVGDVLIGNVPELKAPETQAPGTVGATFDQYLWLQNNPGTKPEDYAQSMADLKVWTALNPGKDPFQADKEGSLPSTLLNYNWDNLNYMSQNPGQATPQRYAAPPDRVVPIAPDQSAPAIPRIDFNKFPGVDYSQANAVMQQMSQPLARVPIPTVADAGAIAGLWSQLIGLSPNQAAESIKAGSQKV